MSRSKFSSRARKVTATAVTATLVALSMVTLGGMQSASAASGSVTGWAFEDFNDNGYMDLIAPAAGQTTYQATDTGVAGVAVKATDSTGAVVGTATTASDGSLHPDGDRRRDHGSAHRVHGSDGLDGWSQSTVPDIAHVRRHRGQHQCGSGPTFGEGGLRDQRAVRQHRRHRQPRPRSSERLQHRSVLGERLGRQPAGNPVRLPAHHAVGVVQYRGQGNGDREPGNTRRTDRVPLHERLRSGAHRIHRRYFRRHRPHRKPDGPARNPIAGRFGVGDRQLRHQSGAVRGVLQAVLGARAGRARPDLLDQPDRSEPVDRGRSDAQRHPVADHSQRRNQPASGRHRLARPPRARSPTTGSTTRLRSPRSTRSVSATSTSPTTRPSSTRST